MGRFLIGLSVFAAIIQISDPGYLTPTDNYSVQKVMHFNPDADLDTSGIEYRNEFGFDENGNPIGERVICWIGGMTPDGYDPESSC